MNPIKAEPLELGNYGYEVSELEALAMEMQGYGRGRREQEASEEPRGRLGKELDEGFWEELFSEEFGGEIDIPSPEGEDEDVNVLANRLGYLVSSPK